MKKKERKERKGNGDKKRKRDSVNIIHTLGGTSCLVLSCSKVCVCLAIELLEYNYFKAKVIQSFSISLSAAT